MNFLVKVVLCRTNVPSWLSRKKRISRDPLLLLFLSDNNNSKKANNNQGSDHLHTSFTNGPGILSSCAQLSLHSTTYTFLVSLSLLHSRKKTMDKKSLNKMEGTHGVEDNPSLSVPCLPPASGGPTRGPSEREKKCEPVVGFLFFFFLSHPMPRDGDTPGPCRELFFCVLDLLKTITKDEINPEGRPFLYPLIFCAQKDIWDIGFLFVSSECICICEALRFCYAVEKKKKKKKP